MADPTNPNDPTYKNDPRYVFSGGRWQFRGDGSVDPNAPAAQGAVHGESLGTQNPSDIFTGLWDRITGRPFQNGSMPAGVMSPNTIPNEQHWQTIARQNAVRQQAANPYDTAIADQSRAGQLALMEQMRAGLDGPSLAAMQGQRAFGQNAQNALGMAAMGGANPRAAMLQAQQVGGGLAGDVGQARLAEVMRQQATLGGAAGNLRGADLRSAEAQMGAGLSAQQIADQRARFYAGMGSDVALASQRNALENYKLQQAMKLRGEKTNADAAQGYMQMLGTLFGMGAGAK